MHAHGIVATLRNNRMIFYGTNTRERDVMTSDVMQHHVYSRQHLNHLQELSKPVLKVEPTYSRVLQKLKFESYRKA